MRVIRVLATAVAITFTTAACTPNDGATSTEAESTTTELEMPVDRETPAEPTAEPAIAASDRASPDADEADAEKGSESAAEPADEGPITSAAITVSLKPHTDDLRVCYDKAREQHPDLEGTLSVKLTVGTDGSVEEVELLGNASQYGALTRCAKRVIQKAEFEPQTETVVATHEILFKAPE